jgi:hypothetical protein
VSGAVSSVARRRDAVALVLVAAGAGAYVYAWRGMQALADRRTTVAPGEYLMTQWNSYHNLSRVGIAGMLAGALVAAWSFYRNRPTPPPTPQ